MLTCFASPARVAIFLELIMCNLSSERGGDEWGARDIIKQEEETSEIEGGRKVKCSGGCDCDTMRSEARKSVNKWWGSERGREKMDEWKKVRGEWNILLTLSGKETISDDCWWPYYSSSFVSCICRRLGCFFFLHYLSGTIKEWIKVNGRTFSPPLRLLLFFYVVVVVTVVCVCNVSPVTWITRNWTQVGRKEEKEKEAKWR